MPSKSMACQKRMPGLSAVQHQDQSLIRCRHAHSATIFNPQTKSNLVPAFSSEALQSHVAAHIKEVALLTLQKLPSDFDENAKNVGSDQPLENDGPGFVKLRGSMYSVLEDEDDSGMTKLHHAVQAGNLRLAESLVYGGANLGGRDNRGRTDSIALRFHGTAPWS